MRDNQKLEKRFLILYSILAIISLISCFSFASEYGQNKIGASGGAVAMGIIFSVCLYLIHSILFKSNK